MSGPNAIARYPEKISSYTVMTTGTANTSRVDPPTASSVVDGTAATEGGAVVTFVSAVATVTNAIGLFQIWKKSSSVYRLLGEVLIEAAVTPSTTVAAAKAEWVPPAGRLFLKSGECLSFSMSKAEVWAITPEQQEY